VSGVTSEVWIGTTQYTRAGAGQAWQVTPNQPANKVPTFVWDYFAPLANAHIVGQDSVGGVPTTVLAAFGNRSGTALWFRFWVDADGLVRQVTMDAPGHFMVDTFVAVDSPVQIEPPVPPGAAASLQR
jgi:hypothetical protein